jgi:ATP-dependent DNA ligase
VNVESHYNSFPARQGVPARQASAFYRSGVAGFSFATLVSVPLAAGLKWTGGGAWIYEEKKDGVRAMVSADGCKLRASSQPLPGPLPRAISRCVFDGELVGSIYWVFDMLIDGAGEDIRRRPLRERRAALVALSTRFPEWICLIPSGRGGEFLKAILAAGGEGIVAKHSESRYGEPEAWIKCKRVETHDCVVTEIHLDKASVRLGNRGWCSATKFPAVKIGDVVEIKCHSITAKGKFREPVLLRIRQDKPACECIG